MSRRYCEVCNERHDNGAAGLCNTHMVEKYERESAVEREQAALCAAHNKARAEFLALPEEQRWAVLFDLAHGYGD